MLYSKNFPYYLLGCAARFRFRSETREIEAKIVSLRSEKNRFFRLFRIEAKKQKTEAKRTQNSEISEKSKAKQAKRNEKEPKNCLKVLSMKNGGAESGIKRSVGISNGKSSLFCYRNPSFFGFR